MTKATGIGSRSRSRKTLRFPTTRTTQTTVLTIQMTMRQWIAVSLKQIASIRLPKRRRSPRLREASRMPLPARGHVDPMLQQLENRCQALGRAALAARKIHDERAALQPRDPAREPRKLILHRANRPHRLRQS